TEVPGSSEVFDCGIVSYANEIKEKLLEVDHELIEKYGVVSPQVAEAMAKGALKISGADIAVSVTGIAGPNPSESGKPAGLSYMALADKDKVWVKEFKTGKSGKGSREYNRYVTASNALNMVRLYLEGKEI
ncbi:MAG: CinA family protein, partial [Clostridiales bacterium]|nr:CinA family protein [Clostridiales bacterium]